MFETGKIYKIKHSRKGVFSLRVTDQSDGWLKGEIVQGTANAILDYNIKETGEDIIVRKSFCTVLLQEAT